MATFTPVNSLEIQLRQVLTDRSTPLWNFYTPLAAAPLWIIIKNYPELDGSDQVAPPGQNPQLCLLKGPTATYLGLYTSAGRAQEAFTKLKLSPRDLCIVSAPGYQLLKRVSLHAADLWINLGLPECQYHPDPDMIEILLSRPEPKCAEPSSRKVSFETGGEPEQHLAPLHDFLGKQPDVRAAWIFRSKTDSPLPPGQQAYEINLLMADPEDKRLLREVEVMAKALTPVEMEWTVGVMLAEDQSLRNLSKQKPPFYARPDFQKP